MDNLEEIVETGLEIAVIGMAGKFPGAKNIRQFWENLKQGVESTGFFNDEELHEAGVSPQVTNNSNLIKSNGAVLDNIEYFDAAFFGYTPMEAQQMAPQIRIFHECLWEALEDTGCDPEQENMLIGLYAGASSTYNWEFLCSLAEASAQIDALVSKYLSNRDFISTLISYKLNLKGPGFFMHSACSTSLAAIHLACQGLLCSDCDMALAGGIALSLINSKGYFYQEGMISSRDGHCRTFDKKAGGTIGGEGAGVVVLKRLEDALTDRDHIYAIIKGSAVNNDGNRKVGFTAPSIEAQAEVIRKALRMAEVKPETISYIETHGTGTPLGDSNEIEALNLAFNTNKKRFCGLGAVKTNIGHLDAAAGVTSLIKTILSIKHKQLTPTLHFETPNPGMNIDNSPFYIINQLKPWHNNGQPLRAGISSFGIGGTNVHLILEEFFEGTRGLAPLPLPDQQHPRQYRLILLSAKTQSALDKITENLAEYLKNHPTIDLADVAYTLQLGRRHWQYRRKLVCSDVPGAAAALTAMDPRKLKTHCLKSSTRKKSIVFLFPGLGSQYVNMGREVYQTEPGFRKEMDRCFEILKPLVDYDLKEILYPGDSEDIEKGSHHSSFIIHHFEVAQLVTFIFQYSLARLLMSWGIQPYAMMGYSFGEYTAACLSAVFTLEDALKLLVTRGKLTRELPPGMMLNVPLPTKEVLPLLRDDLCIGIDNGASCVVSGGLAAVKAFEKNLKQQKVMCMPLDSNHAIHSSVMDPILAKFVKAIETIPLHNPKIPYISSVTGSWIVPQHAVSPTYWGRQLRETVRFSTGIQKLLNEPNSIFLEVGAGRELSALVSREKQERGENQEKTQVIHLIRPKNVKKEIPDVYYLLNKIGLLWLYGVSIDWRQYYAAQARYRVSLPTYPFERQRFWKLVEDYQAGKYSTRTSQQRQQDRDTDATGELAWVNWLYLPSWKRRKIVDTPTRQKEKHAEPGLYWLIFMDDCGLGSRLTGELKKDNHNSQQIITIKKGSEFKKHNNFEYTLHPKVYNHYRQLLQELKSAELRPNRVLHLWGITPNQDDAGAAGNPVSRLHREALIQEDCDQGFYSLLYLAKVLEPNPLSPGKIEINVITNHMQEVTGQEHLAPGKAAVLGPCRTIPQEYPHLTCKSIDISHWENPILIRQLLQEITTSTPEPVIAFRGSRRWIQAFEPLPPELHIERDMEKEAKSTLLRQQGVYLIIGGLGVIGSTLAEYLIKRVNARIILTGRSQLPPRETWGQIMILGNEQDKIYRDVQQMQQLQKLGGDVLYCTADVSDPLQMKECFRQGEEQFGPINGIIHSAGIIAGDTFNSIADITEEQCQTQFQAKMQGLLVLEELLGDKPLDFCLMISSIAAVLGGLGFTAYAAANHFMDAFSTRYNQKGREPWIIVNWDGTNKTYIEKAFHAVLSSNGIEQVIFSEGGNLEDRISRWVKLESLSKDNSNDKDKIEEPALLYLRPELSNPYVAPRNALERQLTDIWQRFFGIQKIGVTDDLYDLGGDSLKAINIISIIHKELEVVVPIKEFFDHSTIEGVARYLAGAEKEEYIPVTPVEKKEYYVLSSAQKRLYILQQLDKDSIAYNSPQVVELGRGVDHCQLENTFRQLIQRHECFRTSIHMVEEVPVQKIYDADASAFTLQYHEVETVVDWQRSLESGKTVNEITNHFVRPFDLSRPSLIRAGLVKTGESRHFLMFDMHHLVTDGVSFEIFIKEITTLYPGEKLPPVHLHYKDYATWQNNPRQHAALDKQEAYWLHHFQGEIPLLNLPIDYARPAVQSFAGRTVAFNLSKEETQHLNHLATAQEVTLFILLLAIYHIFLAKITGQEDIVVGTGILGRRHPDLQFIMGVFVNTLAIRNYPSPAKTLAAFLKEVKDSSLEAIENQEYPFEDLVEKLDVKRDTSRNPLFDTMFVFQNINRQSQENLLSQDPSLEAPYNSHLEVKSYGFSSRISKFDLTLFAEEVNQQLHFTFEYCTKLFKVETIEKFITYFKEIALSCSAAPGKLLQEIKKIPREKKERIIRHLNRQLKQDKQAFAATARDKTLQQELNESFKSSRDKTAIVYGEQIVTYSQLDRQSNLLVNWFAEKGIPPLSLIGVLLEDRVNLITVMIAILKARCVFVPMDSSYPPHRLQLMVDTTGMKFMITSRENSHQWLSTFPGIEEFTFFNRQDVVILMGAGIEGFEGFERLSYPGSSPEDSIYIYFTSGTTGTPRAMAGRNQSLLHFIHWEIHTFGIDADWRFSQLTSPGFDAFLRDIYVPLCTGGAICVPGNKNIILESPRLINWVEQSAIGLIHCVPAVFRMLNSPGQLTGNHFKELRYILLSGERIVPGDLVNWYDTFKERIQLVNLWGTSETTLAKTYYFIRPPDTMCQRIPVGKPIPGARVLVLDENLDICDTLLTGELYIKTPYRTLGYLNDPDLNKERFIRDPLSEKSHDLLHKTGDIGRILADGSIDVLGRNDRQVKLRGIRVELEEIESILIKHPLVQEAVVVKKETSTGNELLCGYITGKITAEPAGKDNIKQYLSNKLPGYMVPGKFIPIEKMPRTPIGKIDYEALPDPAAEEKTGSQHPRNRVEEKLLELWSDILGMGIEHIGVTHSFFELGGNSLNIMTLISRIHREFDIRIPLVEIFKKNTIRSISQLIKTSGEEKYFSIPPVEAKEYYSLSPAQKRLYVIHQLDKKSTTYNIPSVVILEGELDKKRFEETFTQLVNRHESTRTSFVLMGREPVQKINTHLEFKIDHYDLNNGDEPRDIHVPVPQDRIIESYLKPFDLSRAPLIRVGMIKLPPQNNHQQHILMLDIHHIISDGVSTGVLVKDFMALYAGEKLAPLNVQYKDFAAWQNRLIESGIMGKKKKYWMARFAGELPVLEMPTDYPRPSVQHFEGGSIGFTIHQEITNALRIMAAQYGATLYMVLLTIYNILLSKYTGQEDIIIGTPVAGRNHADLENIIGFFINVLPMRNYPEPGKTFEEFLLEVKINTLNAFENQEYQFDQLVEDLGLERDTSRTPLYDVVFTVLNMDIPGIDIPGLQLRPYEVDTMAAKTDLRIAATESEKTIHLLLTYAVALFKKETAQRMGKRFIHIIKQVIDNHQVQIKDIAITDEIVITKPSAVRREEEEFDF